MTEKAKALFFSQYLGQQVVSPSFETSENFNLSGLLLDELTTNIKGELFTINENSLIIKGDFSEGTAGFDQVGQCDIENAHLLLRSIEQLTDQELRTIADMNGWDSPEITKDRYEERLLQYKIDLPCICNPDMKHRHLKPLFDYLILIGILLPFTCLNEDNKTTTLTPDQIIQLGWAKITNK